MRRTWLSGALALAAVIGGATQVTAAPVTFATFATDSASAAVVLNATSLTLSSADVATGLPAGDPFAESVLGIYTQVVPSLGVLPAYFKMSALTPTVVDLSGVTYGAGVFAIGLVSDGTASIPFLTASFSSAALTLGAPSVLLNFVGTTYDLAGFDLSGLNLPGSFGMDLGSNPTPIFDPNNALVGFSFPVVAAFVADDFGTPVPEPSAALLVISAGLGLVRRRRAARH